MESQIQLNKVKYLAKSRYYKKVEDVGKDEAKNLILNYLEPNGVVLIIPDNYLYGASYHLDNKDMIITLPSNMDVVLKNIRPGKIYLLPSMDYVEI